MPDNPSEKYQYQRPDSVYDRIEPGAFRIVEWQRLPKETTPFLIESALQGFGVSLGQLGRLLGTSTVHVSSWKNGRKRLSAAYSGRLLALWSLQNEGIPLQLAHHVHWKTGSIGWNNGNTSQGNHRLAEGWESDPEPRKANTDLLNWQSDGPGPSATQPLSSNK
jgi:DNA-binding transcriptional regulator YiaG